MESSTDETNPSRVVENGPVAASASTRDGEKPWEKAWGIDEMKKSSTDWSLAGDSGLLLHLQACSQSMVSRTHDIQTKVSQMAQEAKLTEVRVNNTFNDFIMLANTQFIENRVYDEDVSQQPEKKQEEKKERTKEEREAELVPRVSAAMQLGLSVIETAFEKLDVEAANSDSDEDEADTTYRHDPILEPKDPYIHRPLPYLIGTQAFLQDDDVGLLDMMPSEEESDHGSISDSASESEEEEETAHRPNSKEHVQPGSDSEYSSEDGSDLFQDKESDDDAGFSPSHSEAESDDQKDKQDYNTGPPDFAAEIAKKISQASRKDNDAPPTPKTKKKKVPTATLR